MNGGNPKYIHLHVLAADNRTVESSFPGHFGMGYAEMYRGKTCLKADQYDMLHIYPVHQQKRRRILLFIVPTNNHKYAIHEWTLRSARAGTASDSPVNLYINSHWKF